MSRRPFVSLAVFALAPTLALAQPSTNLDTYALFAATRLSAKGLTIPGGNVGVNAGTLFVHDFLDAPSSDVAADQVNVPSGAQCTQQFANASAKVSPACGLVGGTPVPIVADVAAACGFPQQFGCDPAMPVVVPFGASVTLPPGTYGDVTVARGATLSLGGGTYQFCNVKVSRVAAVEFQAPAELDVVGRVTIGPSATFGPATGSGLTASDVRVFAGGQLVRFSRASQVQSRLCAPDAALRLTQSGNHVGTFIANTIGTERITVDLDQPQQPQGCRDIGDGFCSGDCPRGGRCAGVDGV